MAVTTTTTRHSFNGSGAQYPSGGTPIGQGPFSINFTIIDADHITVYWTKGTSGSGTPTTISASGNLTINEHYTVQKAGTGSNATITWIESGWTQSSQVTFPTSADLIVITRNVPLTQVTNYQNNATIDAETIEQSFDKLTQTTQQLDDGKDYSFKFATSLAGTTAFDSTVATASTLNVNKADRLNKAIKFNASGNIGVSTYDPDEQVTLAKAEVTTATTQATNAAASATLAGNYANKIDGVVTGSDYSSKAWAVGGTGVTDTASAGASKEWATETSSSVDTSEYSAKEYAVGTQRRGQANGGSSKDWATYTSGTVDNSDYSAKYWALDAEQSKLSAKASASAVANVFDSFNDTFLGSMADNATASSGSANGTWSASSSSITLASTSGTIEVGQEVTGTGIPADANVLSVDGSTIVISENMTNAGSSVSLTFTGQGVYGAFNGSKDGPSTDNDGNALSTGALYFNTTDNEMRVYDGANWLPATSAGSTSLLIYKYLASGSQTTFTGSDANGATLSYVANNILVFLNGVKLDASDFTATNGTSVVLGSGATASDELVIVSFKSFTTADMVPASTGGTFSGNVAVTGNIQVDDIVEKTSGHGIEIDGVTLKDGSGILSGSGNLRHVDNSGTANLTLTAGGNVTLGGTANNIGTVTAGTFNGTIGSSASGAGLTGGLELWRLNTDIANDDYPLGSLGGKWTIGTNNSANTGVATYGSGLISESNGDFTINENGYFLITINLFVECSNSSRAKIEIMSSTQQSTGHTTITEGFVLVDGGSKNKANGQCNALIKITGTSPYNHKYIRFRYDTNDASMKASGATNTNLTYVMFHKISDI